MKVNYARELLKLPNELLETKFGKFKKDDKFYDKVFLDMSYENIIAIGPLESEVPAMKELYKDSALADYFSNLDTDKSYFVELNKNEKLVQLYVNENKEILKINIEDNIANKIYEVCEQSGNLAGAINEKGEHIINLKSPAPGPHFYTNLLLGNRIGFNNALQTTPKSVVDKVGRGGFRSHAATQVLANRWDMLQEENGFPANRQFYIVENGKQIFYSADVNTNIKEAKCIHGQNYTKIVYSTNCGLEIERLIFILPYEEGMPIATEVQNIRIKNNTDKERNIKIVYTGMFGTAATGALMEDVLYSNIIMQSRLKSDENGNIKLYVPHYYPDYASTDARFQSLIVNKENEKYYGNEICTNYSEFVGSGSVDKPEGIGKFTNKLNTKGPGFFAIASKINLKANEEVSVNSFTGCVSNFDGSRVEWNKIEEEAEKLLNKYENNENVLESYKSICGFYDNYKEYLQVETKDNNFDTYVNNNLPFQVLYQTFVSRSFDQTQKGYREIGFREIQDIFASMYYFISSGKKDFIKDLIKEWANKVFEFGYCYHNFFWKGKEPGKWSDDGLWLLQAVYRYINLTDDYEFLNEKVEIAGVEPVEYRSLYETLKSIINYSAVVSVGAHGIPLIDFADWNDCLKVDENFIPGPEKERLYKEILAKDPEYKSRLVTDGSESIMNGFLLKIAIDDLKKFASLLEDKSYEDYLENLSNEVKDNLQKHAWKEDFFARVLFNRYNDEITYLGAANDGFSNDKNINGTYFLNSFSWSILSGVANEEQIEIMLNQVEKYLKTPFGLRLMSSTDLSRVAKSTATGEYFPGDRENGGIFKHATMMATSAMFKAAKEVKNKALAKRLMDLAYWMIDLVVPVNTMKNPFKTCGNPRFCTQYNNSETGENIGPTLSGTSTWLILTLFDSLGVEYSGNTIKINPIMRNDDTNVRYKLNYGSSKYVVNLEKKEGFYRIGEDNALISFDDIVCDNNVFELKDDGKSHTININFK